MGDSKSREEGQEEINQQFEKLDAILQHRPLLQQDGLTRVVRAGEFMLMFQPSSPGNEVAFKHKDTRNYVYMNEKTGHLRVPQSDEPFHLGFFDHQEWREK